MACEWTRETKWRQGSAVTAADARLLGLFADESANSQIAIAVSHDCDLAEDDLSVEPYVEMILGAFVDSPDPNLTYAKSPNRLHIEVEQDGQPKFIELLATAKYRVEKQVMAGFVPDQSVRIDSRSREILQSWLALRYRRAAFPDSLNAHLRPLRETLQKIGKKTPQAIIGFFIYFEPDSELTNPDEPYEVWLVIVFDHLMEGAEEIAKDAADKISKRFESKFRTGETWHSIELRECAVSSDSEFSLYNAMRFKNYPLEYLSLRPSDT